MAVIQKIRNKYGKLAGGVIAFSLVGFILMDAASGRFGDMFGHDTSVAKIDGKKIDAKEYNQRLKDYEALFSVYSQGRPLDENARASLDEQALNELTFEKMIEDECDKLGITTTADEEKELIYGANADPMIQQFKINGRAEFENPETHRFDPQRVKAVEQQLQKEPSLSKILEGWEAIKNYVKRNAKVNKFTMAFMNAAYTPKFVILNSENAQKHMASMNYVRVPYSSVNDNEVKVTDDDIKDYMKKHQPRFTAYDDTRSIDYVTFDIKPVADDSSKSLGELEKIKSDFGTTAEKDIESFVNRNSDDQYNDQMVNKHTFMSLYADSILKEASGSVYGPYFEAGSFRMARIMDKKEMPDSVKVRHILIQTKRGSEVVMADSAAKTRIDSIVAAIKAGADFKEMAAKYSDDQGAKDKGGEYDFTLANKGGPNGLVKEFGDFAFDGKKGETKTIKVESNGYSGYHYVEILDQKAFSPAAKIAIISKALEAGQNTDRAVYARANEFAGRNTTSQAFDDAIKKDNIDKKVADNIKPNDYTVSGLGPSREIIRWAYDAKIGDISPVFSMDGRYVIARLNSIQEKGPQQLTASLRSMLEVTVKNEKKAEIIMNKYKSVASLDAVASSAGQPLQHADSVSSDANFIPNIGPSPKLQGYMFYKGLQLNAVSPAIKAQDAVYFIAITNRWDRASDPNLDAAMRPMMRMSLDNAAKNSISGLLRESIKRKAEIKYNVNNL